MFRPRPVLFDRRQCRVCVDMTGARAVTQLADRVQHIGILVLLVRPGLEVSCVTSGTVGLERRIAPGDLFRVVLMTGGAWKIAGMIQRLIRQSHVPVIKRSWQC